MLEIAPFDFFSAALCSNGSNSRRSSVRQLTGSLALRYLLYWFARSQEGHGCAGKILAALVGKGFRERY